MPRSRHPNKDRGSNHAGGNGHAPLPPPVPENPARSILASVGIRPDRIGQPGYCTLCGRGIEDGAHFDVADVATEPAELGRIVLHNECSFCRFRQATTQFAGPIVAGIRRARMRVFSPTWRCVALNHDGAAWAADLKKLRVIESVGLSHAALPADQPRGLIAGLPIVERTEFGAVVVVRTFDGTQEVHREKCPRALDPELGAFREPYEQEWPETVARAVWTWNSERGWRWWHHVSVARADRTMPTYDDLAIVRREFVTTARECYQIFPPEDRFVNVHERCLHLWHCVDGSALDADTGRVLPQFEEEVSGQKDRSVKLV